MSCPLCATTCPFPDFHGDSTGAALGLGFRARGATTDSAEILQAQFVDKVFMPVGCNDSELVVQTVQETVEVPQLQCFDGSGRRCRRAAKSSSCSRVENSRGASASVHQGVHELRRVSFWGPVRRHRAGGSCPVDMASIIWCMTVMRHRQRSVINDPRPNHHHQAYDSSTRFLVCATVMFPNPADGLCADRAHGAVGAARRRRNRRLRAFLKHERMTVAMNLATIQHHSYMKSAVVDVGVQVGSPLAPVIESYPSSGLVGPQFSLTVDETSHVAPAVPLSVPCQQLPFVYTTTTVTTDDLEEFSEPVYDQVHQEHIAASEMLENIADIPVVHEQVIVQEFLMLLFHFLLLKSFLRPCTTKSIRSRLLQVDDGGFCGYPCCA